MIEEDTVKILKECDSGIKMGVESIDEILDYVKDEKMKQLLEDSKDHHSLLRKDLQQLLDKYHDEGKNPNPVAKGMSWLKTNVKLTVNESDETVADLMVDGCNMGVKSLSKYLNQYKAADEKSKNIAKKLIKIEDDLSVSMRSYL